ncbi:hypothetical protein V2J09_000641 [Rumex salicifolius]
MGRSSRKHIDDSSDKSLSSPSDSSPDVRRRRRRRSKNEEDSSDTDDERRSSSRKRRSKSSSSKRDKSKRKREKRDRDRHGERKRRSESKRRSRRKRRRGSETDEESGSGSSGEEYSEPDAAKFEPEGVARDLLKEFPGVAGDLKQLLQMIDGGQAVDIKGISEKALVKHLNKLFLSLDLEEHGDRVFLLRAGARPTLEVLGSIVSTQLESDHQIDDSHSVPRDTNPEKVADECRSTEFCSTDEAPGPRRKVIGPEMPSAELLAAAAKLTEAEAELRDAELDQDDEFFIGPPPPALVSEVASANEAERFEEITRIMGAEAESPYDILGVNLNMAADNIKKRYWKLSLMVHPDKCSHPQAHQAFVKLNKAFKDLQDPEKRKAMDDKIKKKEEEEEMKVELHSMREAAFWRRSQGIAMEGDDILLAEVDVKEPQKRDEWMTTLPPERKPGAMPMHSTFFSKNAKGRGDTSAWTDTPLDKEEKARKAKMNYLEAYNEATSLAANEDHKKGVNTDAELVDQYNKAKRSKSLVQKHKEETAEKSGSKKKSKQPLKQPGEKREWAGNHPWKPWDREKDLTAGRQSVKLDSENLTQGLTSRFSSGNFQRNFL